MPQKIEAFLVYQELHYNYTSERKGRATLDTRYPESKITNSPSMFAHLAVSRAFIHLNQSLRQEGQNLDRAYILSCMSPLRTPVR
jgi:hypothetical protein